MSNISHGNIIIPAIPIGGFRMIDGGQADDKIIAVMQNDEIYSGWNDIDYLPPSLIERLKHYFLTYKAMPGTPNKAEITHTYGKAEAHEVIRTAIIDYQTLVGA
ncbi:inorganic diphosphatase [Methylomagnum sp.]